AQLDKTFPTNDCAMCILSPKLVEVGSHPYVNILSNAEVLSLEGTVPNLKLTVKKKPRYVNEEKCTGCGVCMDKCPIKIPDPYNKGLSKTKCIRIPFPQAVPAIPIMNKDHCIYHLRGKCGICKKFCQAEAIDFEQQEKLLELEVGSVVLACGSKEFDAELKAAYGYGVFPNVLTSIEFERMISHTGPSNGELLRIDNSQPAKKIAWLQCVGSRDIQKNADFCSNVCCMIAIKEAILAREISNHKIDTTIFYMDMRTCGKSFQRYYDKARDEHNVKFERCKIHSISLDKNTGNLFIRHISMDGKLKEELFDMAILAIGQRPGYKLKKLAKICELPTNPWGFIQTLPFSLTLTEKEGILVGGSVTGLQDISQSLIQASAAALNAGCIIHSKGNKTIDISTEDTKVENTEVYRDVSREPVDLLMIICTCKERLNRFVDPELLTEKLTQDPCINNVFFLDNICTTQGWQELEEVVKDCQPNRLLIGACHPYLYIEKIRELGKKIALDPVFIDVKDIMTGVFQEDPDSNLTDLNATGLNITSLNIIGILNAGAASLKQTQYQAGAGAPTTQRTLVLGGGIAGMTAALGVAEQGYEVTLVEKTDHLGGNLTWIKKTIEGLSCENLLEETISKITKQPLIQVFLNSQIISCTGYAGQFKTIIENKEKDSDIVETMEIEHGATILAMGGNEAKTQSFNHTPDDSLNKAIVTQKELEIKLSDKTIDPKKLNSIVMIQCVDSRQEHKNYCSKVCCPTALKQAMLIKEENPETEVYFLYRDMMTCGFTETYFTQARKDNIIFISYETDNLPQLEEIEGKIIIKALEPVLGRPIEISADMVVLATGITPEFPDSLAEMFGISQDTDGFFQEAEPKWRPLDSIKEGIFACGIVQSPGSIPESIASAQAAAQRALSIISKPELISSRIVAQVRHSLCALC
ncbi:MAG: CoB--CoM heterodisulfide reductase iron-sulfur subunit A family protein, partial [Desulfobacteraceae bacterium]|nr:CoB--CoM heterodisulfide reductase iron-sulfur subunit A family protein [Desulfobacteraceae bacterium]